MDINNKKTATLATIGVLGACAIYWYSRKLVLTIEEYKSIKGLSDFSETTMRAMDTAPSCPSIELFDVSPLPSETPMERVSMIKIDKTDKKDTWFERVIHFNFY